MAQGDKSQLKQKEQSLPLSLEEAAIDSSQPTIISLLGHFDELGLLSSCITSCYGVSGGE